MGGDLQGCSQGTKLAPRLETWIASQSQSNITKWLWSSHTTVAQWHIGQACDKWWLSGRARALPLGNELSTQPFIITQSSPPLSWAHIRLAQGFDRCVESQIWSSVFSLRASWALERAEVGALGMLRREEKEGATRELRLGLLNCNQEDDPDYEDRCLEHWGRKREMEWYIYIYIYMYVCI